MPVIGDVMARAARAGVVGFACCGSAEADWAGVEAVHAAFPGVAPGFGLHPWYIKERTGGWKSRLEELLRRYPSAGVGEAGLDHAMDERNDSEQELVLMEQLETAAKFGRPVSLHCRKAWEAVQRCLGAAGMLPSGFVVHSYSGSPEMIPGLCALGGRISFSGSITRHHSRRGRESCKVVPADRLLIETDSPDLMPVTAGGTSGGDANEPANITYVAKEVAGIRGITVEELATLTTRNARVLFSGSRQ